MMESKISRRTFLGSLGGLTAIALGGCKDDNKNIDPFMIVFVDEPKEKWENVEHVIDNSLEGGFSFNFRDLKVNGIEFGNVVDINKGKHSLDAQGHAFSSKFNEHEKQFAITSLRKNERGFAIELVENPFSVVFEGVNEKKNIVIGDKNYEIVLNNVILPENKNEFYIPAVVLKVNGTEGAIYEGAGSIDNLFMALKLKPYHEKGIVELILSPSYFRSCTDSAHDKQFTGLEHIIVNGAKKVNASRFNNSIQEDAYFRIDALFDENKKIIVLNATDKIRIPDAEPSTYPSYDSRFPISFVPRFPSPFEVLTRVEDKKKKKEFYNETSKGLEGSFSFNFSPPLEARVGLPREGMQIVPEFTNLEFESEGKRYLFRYIAFDANKIPKISQPKELGRNYFPITGLVTEILEEPQELVISPSEEKAINILEEDYFITLKELKQIDGYFPAFDFIFEIKKNDLKDEGLIKTLTYGYPNRVSDINIDPDISHYFGKFDYQVKNSPHRFLVSKNKFSSALDFAGDKQFSALRKILIPTYEGELIEVVRKTWDGEKYVDVIELVPAEKTLYQQVTIANRFNGKIQDSGLHDYAFRADVELGFEFYKGHKDPKYNGYEVIPAKGFNHSDQIKNGYILRIKSLEKVFVGKLY